MAVQQAPFRTRAFSGRARSGLCARLAVTVMAALLGALWLPSAALSVVSFRPPASYLVGDLAGPVDLAAGDFDGDGRVDLVSADAGTGSGDFSVLFGRGDGTFDAAAVFDAHPRPLSVAVGHFDGDALSDIVLPADGTNQVTVLLGNSDRSFDATDYPMGSQPSSVAVGDFNHDGQDDIAALGQGVASVRLGNGDGTFDVEKTYSTGGSGGGSMVAGDFDGDRRDDLTAIPGAGPNSSVAVLLSNSDGTFQAAKSSPLGAFCCPRRLSARDLNGDGRSDAAVSYAFATPISVLLANPDGTFGSPNNLSMDDGQPGDDRSGSPAIGDVDGDGRPDLATSTLTGRASVFVGNGDGSFQPRIDAASGGQSLATLVQDLNGDGLGDLALADNADQAVTVMLNGFVPATAGPGPPPGPKAGPCANPKAGTSAAETIAGTPFGDQIAGLGGNDVVNGLQGEDCLYGGSVVARPAASLAAIRAASSSDGRDRLTGAAGNDLLVGGTDADTLVGGSGKDRLFGSPGNDKLSGGSGNDTLSGGPGQDKLTGGRGNDSLSGGKGKDRLSGGAGDDAINAVDGKKEAIYCGKGRDRVKADVGDTLKGCERVRRLRR